METIDIAIRDKLQRAVLYGLDHYNIPVSFWTYAGIMLNMCSLVARLLTEYIYTDGPLMILLICCVIAGFYFGFYIPTTKLVEYEKTENYSAYEKLRLKYEEDAFVRALTLFFTLFFPCYFTYQYVHNLMSLRIYVLMGIDISTFFTYIFCRCLYTRRRDPPGKMVFHPS